MKKDAKKYWAMMAASIMLVYAVAGLFPDAHAKEMILRLGHVYKADSVPDKTAQYFARLVAEKTRNRIKIDIFPGGQMGSDPELLGGLQLGSVDFAISGASLIEKAAPEYAIIGGPYVFQDWDHIVKVLKGDLGKEIDQAALKNKGIRILGISKRGPRHLTAKKKIVTPDDMKGFKLRLPNIPLQMAVWKSIGANPSPMAWGEVFTALQQGIFDGQENPLDLIYGFSIFEVQSHLILTAHLENPYWYAMSEKTFSKLSKEDRELILAVIEQATQKGNAFQDEIETVYLSKLREKRMIVVEPDKKAFRERAQEGHKAVLKNMKPGFYEALMKLR